MHIRFTCPECREKIELSDYLAGLHTLCPHCKTRILAPDPSRPQEQITAAPPPVPVPHAEPLPPASEKLTTAAPPPEFSGMPRYADDTEAPRGFFPPDQYAPRPLEGSAEGWGPVRVGLILLQVGLSLFAAAIGLSLLLAFGLCMTGGGGLRLNIGFPPDDRVGGLVVGVLLVTALSLLGSLVFVVGLGVCCAVPARTALRGLILAALVCSLPGQALNLVSTFTDLGLRPPDRGQPQVGGDLGGDWAGLGQGAAVNLAVAAFALMAVVLWVVGHFLLAAFLQGVARYFGDPWLIDRAADYMRSLIVLVGLFIGVIALSCVPLLNLLAALAFLVYLVIVFVKLFVLIAATRRTVTNALAGV
jgi:hypothetical protein